MNEINLEAYLSKDNEIFYLKIKISKPLPGEHGDFFCNIHAPKILKSDTKIYGFDAINSQENAIIFLEKITKNIQLVNANGKLIKLKDLIKII